MSATTDLVLGLPFRRSKHISLASTIRPYINAKYDQHPDMFKQDLEAIDALRRDAVNSCEPHPSHIRALQAYAGQLTWIGGKFPIDIGAEFTWYPALGYNTERPMVRNNVKFDLINILYNLAALYSQLGANGPRTHAEGLKQAAHNFNLAAGVLLYIQNQVLPELRIADPPDDMDMDTLEALKQLLLAQSQECSWYIGVVNGLRDISIAKLAVRVSDLYNLAAEAAVKSEAISSAWIHHMTAKHHHFAAAAQFRAASDCLEKKKYGEEVARLKDAVVCVNEGLKATRGGFLHRQIAGDLNTLKKKAEEDLKRAEKDNDMIFLNAVPPKSELKILDRFNMAEAKIPPQVAKPLDYLGAKAELGPPLFSKLVPFSVHLAISIYDERRDRLLHQNIMHELEQLTAKGQAAVSSIGLPGSLQALEKPLGLPPSLVQHAEELRQGDAIGRVHKSLGDIDKLRAADLAMYEEAKAALAAEREEDDRLRSKYGTERWTRPDSYHEPQGAKLWTDAEAIAGYFASSSTSDATVREKFASSEELLRILCGPDRGLMEFVPSSVAHETNEELKASVGKLRSAYNDMLRLESRRRKKIESLGQGSQRDDIKPEILKEAARLERTYPSTAIVPAHFEEFFERRLDRLYEPELEAIEKETQEQQKILAAIHRANREFEAQKRRVTDAGVREREEALQRLDKAYYKYKEVVNNLEVGRKFYNDLHRIVGPSFRDVVKVWVSKRQLEARALEEELSMPRLSRLSLTAAGSEAAHGAAGYGAAEARMPMEAAAVQSWADEELQQPQPQAGGVWQPGMGIKFGGGSGDGQEQKTGTWTPSTGIKFG
ncbi:hypothetical protein CDD82_5390 [Ophiocordyceps australis]|uniref:BRO1 domain-containing protein n=1 Tax=Ophiocordyceps australis TaxID=1399860 RepID=A0A2C5Y639_9HYPO|nr:hypothetical protein CDD82_5390 [Ophiocordyceps australis]